MFSMGDQVILAAALAIHAIAIITAVVAFVGSRRGLYNAALIVCAWVPVCYAVFGGVGTMFDFFNHKDDFYVDMLVFVPLALLVCLAALVSLVRLRQNNRARRMEDFPIASHAPPE
jgi:hypothetical protein